MTSKVNIQRDYSLSGTSTRRAVEAGLASAGWYHSSISRDAMKALMQRRDGPALRDTAIWIVGLALSGYGAGHFWGSWWCVPFFLFMAYCMVLLATLVGTNVAMARHFALSG